MVQPLRRRNQRLVTAEELLAMGDIGPCELVEGVVVRLMPSGGRHSNIGLIMGARLQAYAERTGAGVAFGADGGFVLSRNPDTVRAPDAAFVRTHRIPASGVPDEFFPGPPDLAVEVMSPEDSIAALRHKASEYLEAGSRAVWLVLPSQRIIEVHESGGVRVYRGRQWVRCGSEAPGFKMRVADLFGPTQPNKRRR
jgi:Uma2 family endonuclease